MKPENNKILGKTSYSAIVTEIYEKIQKTQAATLTGNEFLKDMYVKLNESITPLIDLKTFKTNAEQIAPEDVKLSEVLKFIDSKVNEGSADLNFIINLCKEEHFKEMTKINHPAPKDTINAFSDMFNQTGPVIEQGIKNGVFDSMKSSLLNKIKSDIVPKKTEPNKKLNEDAVILSGNVAKYAPVGITYNDLKNNRLLLMFENECVQFNSKTKQYTELKENFNIPDAFKSLMTAANTCQYDPETELFGLNENWDFDMRLNAENGIVTINGKTMDLEQVPKLLKESIALYESDNSMVSNFNKVNYLKDADNLLLLANNSNMIKQFESLSVVKNLSTDNYVVFANDVVAKKPAVLATNIKTLSSMHESFSSFVNGLNNGLNLDVTKMFESQINNETKLINDRYTKLANLNESLIEANTQRAKLMGLKGIPEPGSPESVKLNEQDEKLNTHINGLIQNINFYKNDFKLYD